MNPRLVFLFLALSSYVKEGTADESKDCKDFRQKMLLDQLKFVLPCMNKLGLSKPQEKKEKVFCIMKCVLQDGKMLGADGHVDFDLLNGILETIPPNMKEKAQAVITDCGHLAADLDPKEDKCTSYGPLLTCLTDVAATIC